ncbi:MAG TPA: complex I NDUFA9 subunit family protein [Gemmatimonadaceae bacterium]
MSEGQIDVTGPHVPPVIGLVEDPEPAPISQIRTKPVLVTGASGLVGTHTCRALAARGWKIRALVRNAEKAAGRLAGLPVEIVTADVRDRDALVAALRGTSAIVHLAAIAIERRGQSYESVNAGATSALLDAAREAGVTRLVHMSQNGASSQSASRFLRSKGIAEDLVRASSLEWTIIRPSVIVGPEDEFVSVLARLVRLTPVVFPLPGGGEARFQPIAVRDVAQVVALALDQRATIGGVYTIGGPVPLTLRQMTERILAAMGERRIIIGVSTSALRPLIAVAARLLPNPPVTPSLLDLLDIDNTTPDNAITQTFGIVPTPFAPEELTYLREISARDALSALFTR